MGSQGQLRRQHGVSPPLCPLANYSTAGSLYGLRPYLIGSIICVIAKDLNYLWAGRALAGAGSCESFSLALSFPHLLMSECLDGLFYSAQIYVMELAPAKARGLLGSLSNGIAVEIG